MNNKTHDFHIIADKPILDNRNVIHHMLMYGCENAGKLSFLGLNLALKGPNTQHSGLMGQHFSN